MPPTLTFPGIYIEEVPSGVRTITGVATSITAFVGYHTRGPGHPPTPTLFNVLVKDVSTGVVETLRNLPPSASLPALVEQQSSLVRVTGSPPTQRPDEHAAINPGEDPFDPAVPARFTAFPTTGGQ